LPDANITSRRKILLLGLSAIVIILVGYVAYLGIDDLINSSNLPPSTKPVIEQLIPPAYPNNPSNYPLVSNYTITIPKSTLEAIFQNIMFP